VRCLDSAKENVKMMQYELSVTELTVYMIVVFCMIHVNHANTTTAIKAFGIRRFNSLFSCSLLCRLGGNFNNLLQVVPVYVAERIDFLEMAPVDDFATLANRKICELIHFGRDSLASTCLGERFLEFFDSGWWENRLVVRRLSSKAAFEEASPVIISYIYIIYIYIYIYIYIRAPLG
jgi:hypothetical protein